MKLAEALLERADLQTKIEMLRSRMINNAKVQEGAEPNEKTDDLLKELDEKMSRLEFLISHINRTNSATVIENGLTIADYIAKRDVLAKKISLLGSLVESGNQVINRLTHTEIRIKSAFNVSKMQKNIDGLSKQLRLLDTKLQEMNWLTELI